MITFSREHDELLPRLADQPAQRWASRLAFLPGATELEPPASDDDSRAPEAPSPPAAPTGP